MCTDQYSYLETVITTVKYWLSISKLLAQSCITISFIERKPKPAVTILACFFVFIFFINDITHCIIAYSRHYHLFVTQGPRLCVKMCPPPSQKMKLYIFIQKNKLNKTKTI